MLTDTIVLPNFLVIGVVKGGTTSLYDYLHQHPDVYMSPVKETNHFAAKDMDHDNFSREYRLDVTFDFERYYASGMKEHIHIGHIDDEQDYARLYANVNGEKAIGEISNSYAVCESAALEIKKSIPNAKIVIMLRNPITRMWSQYLMNLREGKTAQRDFVSEVRNDLQMSNRGWGVTHLYHELGMYHQQILRYRELFGENQFKILIYEEYRDNPNAALKELFEFLEIDPDVSIDFSKKMNTASMPRFKRLNDFMVRTGALKTAKNLLGRKARQSLKGLIYSNKNVPKMDAVSRRYLVDYYKNDVTQLSALLNKDLTSLWGFNSGDA